MTVELEAFHRGDTLNLTFTFTNKVTGAAVDITGWQVWLTLKDAESDLDASAVIQKKVTAPAGADATAGILSMVVTSVDTAITAKSYYYDVQRIISGSPPDVQTVTEPKSRVKVYQDIALDDA